MHFRAWNLIGVLGGINWLVLGNNSGGSVWTFRVNCLNWGSGVNSCCSGGFRVDCLSGCLCVSVGCFRSFGVNDVRMGTFSIDSLSLCLGVVSLSGGLGVGGLSGCLGVICLSWCLGVACVSRRLGPIADSSDFRLGGCLVDRSWSLSVNLIVPLGIVAWSGCVNNLG